MERTPSLKDVQESVETISQVERIPDMTSVGECNSPVETKITNESSPVGSVDSDSDGCDDLDGFVPKGPPTASVNTVGITSPEEERNKRRKKREEDKKKKEEEEKRKNATQGGK